jgi:hypothetical protein
VGDFIVRVADLLGNGVADLVEGQCVSKEKHANYRYEYEHRILFYLAAQTSAILRTMLSLQGSPTPTIPIIAAASKQQEKHRHNQNG